MKLKPTDKAPNFTFDTPDAKGLDFYEALKARRTILIFSRYIGCSLCQLKLMETVRGYDSIVASGGDVLFFLQSTEENAKERLREMGVKFTVVLDPEQKIYKLYDVTPAKSKLGLVSPKVLGQMQEIKKLGIQHGAYEGDELQLPATFIVDDQAIVWYARYAKNAGDMPDNQELLALLKEQ